LAAFSLLGFVARLIRRVVPIAALLVGCVVFVAQRRSLWCRWGFVSEIILVAPIRAVLHDHFLLARCP
jgi:hypothetical protein